MATGFVITREKENSAAWALRCEGFHRSLCRIDHTRIFNIDRFLMLRLDFKRSIVGFEENEKENHEKWQSIQGKREKHGRDSELLLMAFDFSIV